MLQKGRADHRRPQRKECIQKRQQYRIEYLQILIGSHLLSCKKISTHAYKTAAHN